MLKKNESRALRGLILFFLSFFLLLSGCGPFSGAIAETPTASSIAEDSAGPAADIPAYSGEPYAIINDNIPLFSDSDLVSVPEP